MPSRQRVEALRLVDAAGVGDGLLLEEVAISQDRAQNVQQRVEHNEASMSEDGRQARPPAGCQMMATALRKPANLTHGKCG